MAAQNGYGAVLNFLLEQGADPEQKWALCFLGKYRVFKWCFARSPLKAAGKSGHLVTERRLECLLQEKRRAVKLPRTIAVNETVALMPGIEETRL
ncbi:hypothetical protein [Endozoicomonas sp. ALC013]|uniref:hypothetical protein n=1 Tax=Endozoicomonas sp. ALC013 TaxID=3403076 RepID=UPI003BB6031F